jgi:hypothetical protein
MGLFENLVWVVFAIGGVCIWPWLGGRAFACRHRQLKAGVFQIVILYPVVSVSDDLRSMRNPKECGTGQRRGQGHEYHHNEFAGSAELPVTAFGEGCIDFRCLDAPTPLRVSANYGPSLDPLQSRPPPLR